MSIGVPIGGAAQSAPGGPFTLVVDEIVPANTVVISAANTVVHNQTFTTPSGATKALVRWSLRVWESNAPGGPYLAVQAKLDGATAFPRGPVTGNAFSTNTIIETSQQDADEWKTVEFLLPTLSAGSHTVQLLASPIHSAGTLAYDWSLMVVEFLP